MWDTLIKLAIAGAAAYGANKVVKKTTGKSIVEHAINVWYHLRDRINAWLEKHPDMKGKPLIRKIVNLVDNYAVAMARITIAVKTGPKKGAAITSVEVSQEEAAKRFPTYTSEKWQPLELEELS